MSKDNKKIELDPKTEALFTRKGYVVGNKIAEGAFGQVYKGLRTIQETGETTNTAVKVMDLDKCNEKLKDKFIPRELGILAAVHHPYIIGILDMFKANHKIYIFMEFAPNGTIADVLKKQGALPEAKCREWFIQMMEALNFMHTQKGIAHRDLKVENVLLDEKNVTKLSDFGFARLVYDISGGDEKLSSTFCGTEPYYSPQLVSKVPYKPFKADVWAMGVVLFAMKNNKFPFHFKDKKKFQREQEEGDYKWKEEASPDLKDLVKKMFVVDPEERVSSSAILRHPWIRKARGKR